MIHPSKKVACACPLNGKICTDGVREDFPENPAKPGHKVQCRWWQHIYGKDPQTEQIVDEFDCSIPWLTVTTVETSQNARGAAASTDKVANVMHSAMNRMVRGMLAIAKRNGVVLAPPPDRAQLNGKDNGK